MSSREAAPAFPLKRLTLAVVLTTLVPYFVLSFFAYPSTDDFAYANHVLQHGVWGAQSHIYQTWSGRYVANLLLSLNPVAQKWIWGFPILPLLLLLGLWGSLYFLCRQWSGKQISRSEGFFIASFLLSLVLSFMQIPVQAFYWLAGSVTYTLPLILATFAAGLGLDLFRDGELAPARWAFLFLAGPLIVGCNETIMLQWMTGLVVVQIFFWLQYRRWPLPLGILTALSLAGAVVVIKAPGNAVRTSHFADAHRPFYALYRTVGASLEHLVQFLSPALLLFSLLFIAWAIQNRERLAQLFAPQVPAWIPRAAFGMMLFTAFFPALWSMGGNPPKRVDNTTYFWFVLFWFLLLAHWVYMKPETFARWRTLRPWLFDRRWLGPAALLSLILIGNHRHALMDLFVAPQFRHEWHLRQQLSEQTVAACATPELQFEALTHHPRILFNEDFTNDPNHWNNLAWATYFSSKAGGVCPNFRVTVNQEQ